MFGAKCCICLAIVWDMFVDSVVAYLAVQTCVGYLQEALIPCSLLFATFFLPSFLLWTSAELCGRPSGSRVADPARVANPAWSSFIVTPLTSVPVSDGKVWTAAYGQLAFKLCLLLV